MSKAMLMRLAVTALGLGGMVLGTAPAEARRDQDDAYRAARSGEIRPLPDIRARVHSRMSDAQPLGEEYDPASRTYRLKYLRSGSVVWVDVDARTGAVVRRSGN